VRSGFHNIYRDAAMFGVNSNRYCSLAYSALASIKDGDVGVGVFSKSEKIFVGR
jgi:hypothetical protein